MRGVPRRFAPAFIENQISISIFIFNCSGLLRAIALAMTLHFTIFWKMRGVPWGCRPCIFNSQFSILNCFGSLRASIHIHRLLYFHFVCLFAAVFRSNRIGLLGFKVAGDGGGRVEGGAGRKDDFRGRYRHTGVARPRVFRHFGVQVGNVRAADAVLNVVYPKLNDGFFAALFFLFPQPPKPTAADNNTITKYWRSGQKWCCNWS